MSQPVPHADRPALSAEAVLSAEDALLAMTHAVQELSLANSAERVQEIVRITARRLTGADGATFVLRDRGECIYVDEDAIAPLWKGQRFPLEACISGWAMLNRKHVAIEDIYLDDRIPHDAYRPTFVKSLLMVPIRTMAPMGSIGIYWAKPHRASEQEIGLARALADSTAIALENVQRLVELNQARALAETDPLTGVANRRAWDSALAEALESPVTDVCVALIDIDHFKRFNDEHGHPAGDRFLRETTAAWSRAVRTHDFLARLGGEEFGVILAGCEIEEADMIARRIRASLHGSPTASVGVAKWDGIETPDELSSRADRALYDAKASGRDGIAIAR